MSDAPGGSETTVEPETGPDTRETRDDRYDTGTMRWVSGIVSLIGLWIAASALVYPLAETGLWNNVIMGVAIFLIAGYNSYRAFDDAPISVGSAALVAVLGLWVLVSPFALDLGSEAATWRNVVSGLLVAILAGYNAYATQQVETARTTGART